MYIETNENETKKFQDAAKVLLGEKFIALKANFKKQGNSQINNLTLFLN